MRNFLTRRPKRTAHPIFGLMCGAAIVALSATWAAPALAVEGGASVYLLGSGGPEAAVMPPLKGVYFGNTFYLYDGESGGSQQFVIGGNVVADLNGTIIADFPSVLWVPDTDLLGGVLGFGAALPVGNVDVDVSGDITGPLGNQVSFDHSDSATVFGDPLLTAALGWHWGNYHVAASTFLNIPIGNYHEHQLANLAFHRWAQDFSLAGTWHDDESGWDISAKAGVTFNGLNTTTDYNSGNDFHLEGAVEKTFDKKWSLGLQGYYYNQISGDSGSGARLGSFEGEVTGVGAALGYNFTAWEKPATLKLHAATEFDATNRLEGTAVWLDFSIPLAMQMPPH